jgi:hypothetical protein
MTTNVELYEALKPSIGQDAARMIAEVVPPTRDLATKADVETLRAEMRTEFASVRGEMRTEFAGVRGEMREGFALVRAEMHADRVSLLKWMIGMFVPVWLGSWGTVVAVLLQA